MKKLFYTLMAALVFPVAAHAAGVKYFDQGNELSGSGAIPTKTPDTTAFIFIGLFLDVLGLIALVLIIYGGVIMMTSQGSPDKVKKGRDILIWAILGVVVILSALSILSLVDTALDGQ